jgi:hypothetical protein
VSARLQVVVIAFHLGVGLAVLAAVTLLAALDKPVTPVTAGIFGAVLGLAGAGGVAAATLGAAVNGKSVVSPGLLANQQQIIRESAHLLASQEPVSAAALERATGEAVPPLPGDGGT